MPEKKAGRPSKKKKNQERTARFKKTKDSTAKHVNKKLPDGGGGSADAEGASPSGVLGEQCVSQTSLAPQKVMLPSPSEGP